MQYNGPHHYYSNKRRRFCDGDQDYYIHHRTYAGEKIRQPLGELRVIPNKRLASSHVVQRGGRPSFYRGGRRFTPGSRPKTSGSSASHAPSPLTTTTAERDSACSRLRPAKDDLGRLNEYIRRLQNDEIFTEEEELQIETAQSIKASNPGDNSETSPTTQNSPHNTDLFSTSPGSRNRYDHIISDQEMLEAYDECMNAITNPPPPTNLCNPTVLSTFLKTIKNKQSIIESTNDLTEIRMAVTEILKGQLVVVEIVKTVLESLNITVLPSEEGEEASNTS